MSILRRKTRQVYVKDVAIGGGAPISIQSMTKTDTADVEATVRQIFALATIGCEIVRVAVPSQQAAQALPEIRRAADKVPLVADIHFHPQLAIAAVEAGFDKIRWNPGNIRNADQVKQVVAVAKKRSVPIRVGVNVGSLDPESQEAYPNDLVEAIVRSALKSVGLLEDLGFQDIVLSLKSSDVLQMLAAYRRMAELCDYPFHLGVTEAGLAEMSTVKSSIGIGALLAEGIGDTLRVSIAGDPIKEVEVAKRILAALEIRRFSANVIACPSCGRCEIDVAGVAREVERRLNQVASRDERVKKLTVAVMGCVVNGPGESERADVGLAGGAGVGVIYRGGKQVRRAKEEDMVDALITEVELLLHEQQRATHAVV